VDVRIHHHNTISLLNTNADECAKVVTCASVSFSASSSLCHLQYDWYGSNTPSTVAGYVWYDRVRG
jgi:hypothetical protein